MRHSRHRGIKVCFFEARIKTDADTRGAATYRRISKVDLRIPQGMSAEARDLITKVCSSLSF